MFNDLDNDMRKEKKILKRKLKLYSVIRVTVTYL